MYEQQAIVLGTKSATSSRRLISQLQACDVGRTSTGISRAFFSKAPSPQIANISAAEVRVQSLRRKRERVVRRKRLEKLCAGIEGSNRGERGGEAHWGLVYIYIESREPVESRWLLGMDALSLTSEDGSEAPAC